MTALAQPKEAPKVSIGGSRIAKLSRYFLECIAHDYLEASAFASDKYDNPDYAELNQMPYRAEDQSSGDTYLTHHNSVRVP